MISANDKGHFSIDRFEIQAVAVEKNIVQWRVCDEERIRYLSFDLTKAVQWVREELED